MTNEELLHQTRTTNPESAVALQEQLRHRVILKDDFGPINTVAGVDVGFEDHDQVACAAIAVLRFSDLTVQESVAIRRPVTFPYIPGLLAFREVPIVMEALQNLRSKPDLLICDGNGYIHPRRCGFACHLGLVSGLPTMGIAKTPYVGKFEPLPETRGSWQPILDAGETIGAALRTQKQVKPIYVSVGHRMSLSRAIDFALKCSPRYRLPETTRQADQLSKGNAQPVMFSSD